MTWFQLLLSSYPDFPPHIHTLLSLLPIISKKEGTRYLSNVAANQQPAGALAVFLHSSNICQYQPIYTPPTYSLCSLCLQVPSNCASGPFFIQPQTTNKPETAEWICAYLVLTLPWGKARCLFVQNTWGSELPCTSPHTARK